MRLNCGQGSVFTGYIYLEIRKIYKSEFNGGSTAKGKRGTKLLTSLQSHSYIMHHVTPHFQEYWKKIQECCWEEFYASGQYCSACCWDDLMWNVSVCRAPCSYQKCQLFCRREQRNSLVLFYFLSVISLGVPLTFRSTLMGSLYLSKSSGKNYRTSTVG